MSVTTSWVVTFHGPCASFDRLGSVLQRTCGDDGDAKGIYYRLDHAAGSNDSNFAWPTVKVSQRLGSFGDVER